MLTLSYVSEYKVWKYCKGALFYDHVTMLRLTENAIDLNLLAGNIKKKKK